MDCSVVVQKVCMCRFASINFVVKLYFSQKSFLPTLNWNYLPPQIWQSLICGLKVCSINGYLFDRANNFELKNMSKGCYKRFGNACKYQSVSFYVQNVLVILFFLPCVLGIWTSLTWLLWFGFRIKQ
jgi:hypothetical protein